MLKKRNIVSLLFVLCFTSSVYAQTGCSINNSNDVYLNRKRIGLIGSLVDILVGGRLVYNEAGAKDTRETACVSNSKSIYLQTTTPASTCLVCPDGVSLGGILGTTVLGCNNNNELPGIIAQKTTVVCPLDDYSWALGASASALGIIYIRKRRRT